MRIFVCALVLVSLAGCCGPWPQVAHNPKYDPSDYRPDVED